MIRFRKYIYENNEENYLQLMGEPGQNKGSSVT
jgi:hypothetical protein